MSAENQHLQQELQQIEKAISDLNKMTGILSAEKIADSIAELEQQQAKISLQLGNQSIAVVGDHNTAIGSGGVNVSGQVGGSIITNFKGNLYIGGKPDNNEQAIAIYQEYVARTNSRISLRGIDVKASDPTADSKPLALADLYIDLDTDNLVTISAEEVDSKRVRQRTESVQTPETALQAVVANPYVVLKGDPGGGKSTFMKHLAYTLAQQNWTELADWPHDQQDILPILVILRDFARQYGNTPLADIGANDLWQFIVGQLKRQNLEFMVDILLMHLDAGRVVLLLDGLDEVPNRQQRLVVKQQIEAFIERYSQCRTAVTCRIRSYQEPASVDEPDLRLHPEQFQQRTLAPLTDEKIDRFITLWHEELHRIGTLDAAAKDDLAAKLRQAVRRRDLARLTPNPLMLTIMAAVHTTDGELPDARAPLYEKTINTLLLQWETMKLAGEEKSRLRQLLDEAKRAPIDLKKRLRQLAYERHHFTGTGEQDSDALADIPQWELVKMMGTLKRDLETGQPDLTWAQTVVETMKLRAGLLLERENELFTFPHRTFQEYLAGVHLANLPDFHKKAVKLASEGALWREVILLAVGHLVYGEGNTLKPMHLVYGLCPNEIAAEDVATWRSVILAGDVLLEIGLQRVLDEAFGQELLTKVWQKLLALITENRLPAPERAVAADTLAQLGDPRGHVLDIDQMRFCWVPKGDFYMGSDTGKAEEKPMHLNTHLAYDYWLAEFPVTVAQFRQYVQESGNQPRRSVGLDYLPTRPIVYVTWYEAKTFCKWVTDRWRIAGWLKADQRVTLPSEAEWEKAARGGIDVPITACVQPMTQLKIKETELKPNRHPQADYTWLGKFDADKVNCKETKINQRCGVGCFSEGKSVYGCQEMLGNVWEWTRSIDKPYPYDPHDGREDVERVKDDDWIRLRGGAYYSNQGRARCGARDSYYPNYWSLELGCRLVVAPIL
ncbi:MAG: SUMF1/EgtB/PvdO family nonheme iron enzyme [bacterium]|nr:SUMF1/EgtB/PvdO family nonheme iron enzyme [bacterium]